MLEADAKTHQPIIDAQNALNPDRVWPEHPQTVVNSWAELVLQANFYRQKGLEFCSLDCVRRRSVGFWVPSTDEWFVVLLTVARETCLTPEQRASLEMGPDADLRTIEGRWAFFGNPMNLFEKTPV